MNAKKRHSTVNATVITDKKEPFFSYIKRNKALYFLQRLRLKTNSRTAKMLVTCNEFVDIHEIVI